jgi:arylsulfatase A-like enzyme
VRGVASRLPDSGETVTELAFNAELFNIDGTQSGARGAAAAAADPSPNTVAPTINTRMDSSMGPQQNKRLDRRTFLKRGAVAGGLLAAGGLGVARLADATQDESGAPASTPTTAPPTTAPSARRPNILVIMVDQLRYPVWFSPMADGTALPPNMRRLREGAVSFAGHYTAANDCSPSRSTLVTGLYTHQTGCMITGGSTLDPGFPTWGAMLREHGYGTRWYGKWHLTHRDGKWSPARGRRELARYGFAGGTFPSPDGAPGQGWRVDGHIARQFAEWYASDDGSEPWCTTVSFVNPHDIAWWYRWSDRVLAEASARSVTQSLPGNFETPQLLIERGKPALQRSLQETAATSFGPVPFEGPEVLPLWTEFLNLYGKLQRTVDQHVGTVLDALASRPEIAANTVIVFTSDHGEYGGSHGLRGKGAGAYEEAIHVPLIVKDNRGVLTAAPESSRTQLTSSVDVAPLLLTLATGSNAWREQPRYEHLAKRADLAAMLTDSSAPGRPYVLHATDETVTEFAIEPYAADAPRHVIAMRTPEAKYATYSNWEPDGIGIVADGQERELYDFGDDSGRLELHNAVGQSELESSLVPGLERAIEQELREPLPVYLDTARRRGLEDYYATARAAANSAAATHERHAEKAFRGVEEAGATPTPTNPGETRFRALKPSARSKRRAPSRPRSAPVPRRKRRA